MANQKDKTLTWTASEYIDHKRGLSWYLLLGIGTGILAAGVYLLTKDYFATAVIVVLGIIMGVVARWKPQQVDYELSAAGLRISDKEYSYNQFKTFSVIHEGDLTSLVFIPIKRFMPPVSVFFDESEEDTVMEIVGEHLPLEERTMDRVDRLSRRLRF